MSGGIYCMESILYFEIYLSTQAFYSWILKDDKAVIL